MGPARQFLHEPPPPQGTRPPNGSRLSCGRPARRRKAGGRQSMPRQGHNTPLPLKRSPPVSFKRMLDGALFTDARARRAPRAAQSPRRPWIGKLLWATTHYGDVRGAAGLCRAVGVVERGEQILPRAPRRSAPRALTVPKELTKGCL